MDSFGKSITKLTLALPPPAGGQCPGSAGIHSLVHIHSLLTSVTITALVSAWGGGGWEGDRKAETRKVVREPHGTVKDILPKTTALVRASCNFNITLSALAGQGTFHLKNFLLTATVAISEC